MYNLHELTLVKDWIENNIDGKFVNMYYNREFFVNSWNICHSAVIDSGMSRLVIIPKAIDWVIKVDRADVKHDYCIKEYNLYMDAIEQDVAEFFLPLFYIGTKYGIDFYAQPKGESCTEEVEDSFYTSCKDWMSYNYSHYSDYDITEEMECMSPYERAFSIFGENSIADFCEEENIQDLHGGNFIRRNGNIYISDYASYHG